MKIFLTSAYPYHPRENFAVSWLKESAIMDPFKEHSISEDPETADAILFTEHHPPGDPYFFQVLKNELYRRYKEKVILYTDGDKPLPVIPSILPSVERKYYRRNFTRSGPYIARHCENDSIHYKETSSLEKKFLFSFIGAARTHAIRNEILSLVYPFSFIKDTSKNNLWELEPAEKRAFESEYVKVSLSSHFILCPRGEGVNSYRLYEAMQMGLVPVIISDDWIPMEGPDWNKFSIRIAENEIQKIPDILLSRKSEAETMGKLARNNWERWFSKEVCFHHIASMCQDLLVSRNNSLPERFYSYSQFLRPFHTRNLLRFYKNRLL